MKRLNSVKEHTPGQVRYFTYYLIWPGEKDYWVDQTPVVHDLQFALSQSRWRDNPQACNDLIRKGETTWKDHNGVTHRVVLEDKQRPRKWGVSAKA